MTNETRSFICRSSASHLFVKLRETVRYGTNPGASFSGRFQYFFKPWKDTFQHIDPGVTASGKSISHPVIKVIKKEEREWLLKRVKSTSTV